MENKHPNISNIVDIFTRKPVDDTNIDKFIRLSPELDGLEMLYSNDSCPGKLYSIKILCWALMKNGTINALVPWLNKIVSSKELNDPLNGHWEGYYDSFHNHLFFEAPDHKEKELKTAENFFRNSSDDKDLVIQEFIDTTGTHVVLSEDQLQTIVLAHVTSWRLFNDGRLHAMIADETKITSTPVLIGDDCLFSAQEHKDFRYFFHYSIANKIKHGDQDAIASLNHLRT
ncbi:MAG: hypothetical protein QS748_04745 [Candidatus Endonucleobacter bathymodioli]|uniref:Uncharacterized protein n=1 Tax=Candidatus Endonucleibacter bathymodioli TaxID=539814 RepID=A0AA90NKC3_9GAMM|nr:hypothetical protein [Candidatus Endonucleobacter bathymodioli]